MTPAAAVGDWRPHRRAGGVGHALSTGWSFGGTRSTAFRRSRVAGRGGRRGSAPSPAARPGGRAGRGLLTPGTDAAGDAEHAAARAAWLPGGRAGRPHGAAEAGLPQNPRGLEKVDVIVAVRRRRHRPAGAARLPGVPGLWRLRAGNVAGHLRRAAGVESRQPPRTCLAACRVLLGEEYRPPPAPLAWAAMVLRSGSMSLVKPAYAGPLTPGIGLGAVVSARRWRGGRRPALAAIAERPDAFALQEAVPVSTTPAWNADALDGVAPWSRSTRPPGARAFVGPKPLEPAVRGDARRLGRVSGDATSRLTSMRRGGGGEGRVGSGATAAEPATQAPAEPAAGRRLDPRGRRRFPAATPVVRGS